MGRSGWVTQWLVLLVVAVLALGSCGDDGDGTAATGDAATTSAAEGTATTQAPTTSTAGGSTTVAAGGTTTTEAVAPPSTPAVELACETVGFTPNSEDAASDVRATGLTCEEAEAFVRTAGEVTSSGGPEELDVAGYRCVRIATEEEPLPTSTYRCSMGPKQVTFVRS